MLRFIAHPEAEQEARAGARFYEDARPGYARKYLEALALALRQVREHPTRWRICRAPVRRYLVRTFPYSILYVADAEGVYVLAFKHHKRHPDYWRRRLDDLDELKSRLRNPPEKP